MGILISNLLKLIMSGKVLSTMKLFRTMTIMLIFALATGPALAAVCAVSCASKSIMTTVNADHMPTMMNCHEGATHKESTSSDKSGTEYKSCSMGAGCHFAQATPVNSASKYVFINATSVSFPRFDPSEKSIDLSPPLKPPA
jgi:hypothetical protein